LRWSADQVTARTTGLSAPSSGHGGHKQPKEDDMAGMLRKLIASGVAAKVIQEARKPQNQAKIKKMIADFQNKQRGGQTGRKY
jgi:hypothetical protein